MILYQHESLSQGFLQHVKCCAEAYWWILVICYLFKYFQGDYFILNMNKCPRYVRKMIQTNSVCSISQLFNSVGIFQSCQSNMQTQSGLIASLQRGRQTWAQRLFYTVTGVEVDVCEQQQSARCALLWEWDSAALRSLTASNLHSSTNTQTKMPLCGLSPAPSISANRHCLCFPLLRTFRMIIVWHIQYVNIIIVSGRGPVIMEQEVTCQDPWWPQRESGDLRITPCVCPGLQLWWRQVGCSAHWGGEADRWGCSETRKATMCWKFPLKYQL